MAQGAAPDEPGITPELAASLARTADAAVITIGRNSGEGRDRSRGEGDFLLSRAEMDMIAQTAGAFQAQKKKIVVVLNIAGVIETASWKDIPDAVVLAWQGGQETGHAVADVLSGRVNPSGKLATTFPVRYEDHPSSASFPGRELPDLSPAEEGQPRRRSRPAEIVYDEGVFVGYRFFETYKVKPSYEFGYGLSYTNFAYENLTLSSTKFRDRLRVMIEVRNTGGTAGKEAVELYLSAPSGRLEKPALELKGFAKTRLLRPGEAQTLSFVLDGRSLASFDPAESAWIAEAGVYAVKVGASSADIRKTASFRLERTLTVKKESRSLIPKMEIRPSAALR